MACKYYIVPRKGDVLVEAVRVRGKAGKGMRAEDAAESRGFSLNRTDLVPMSPMSLPVIDTRRHSTI
jgi:hypothetical protein